MHYIVAAEYAGIGAWEVALKQALEENGDTFELAYYAEWDDKASNAYYAIHNVSEDFNIWDTSLGYREFEIDGIKKYGVYTCMFGKTYEYYQEKRVKIGENILEDGEIEDVYETQLIYDDNLVYNDIDSCISRVCEIRSKHPKFKVDEDGQFILPKIDILFYSPPCQSYSIAGKRKGSAVDKGNMFWNTLIRIKKLNPMYAIMENVKGLPSGGTKKDFNNMLESLSAARNHNYWKILNSKDFGIPQNRERVFIHSIRQDLYDQGKRFYFPQPFKLEIALKDILEDEADEKYYLSQNAIDRLINNGDGFSSKPKDGNDIASTLMASQHKICRGMNIIYAEIKQLGNISESESFGGNPQTGRIYDVNGISPTLSTMQGGGQEPKVVIPIKKENYVLTVDGLKQEQLKINSATKGGYEVASPGDSITLDQPKSTTRRGRVGKEVSQTLTTSCNIGYYNGLTIRKLTPLECWRLQGFKDEHYYLAVLNYVLKFNKATLKNLNDKIEIKELMKEIRMNGITNNILTKLKEITLSSKSDSQMYMRAGNSITVDVVYHQLLNLLYDREQEGQQMSLF